MTPSGETLHLEERGNKHEGLTACADLTATATAITHVLPGKHTFGSVSLDTFIKKQQ